MQDNNILMGPAVVLSRFGLDADWLETAGWAWAGEARRFSARVTLTRNIPGGWLTITGEHAAGDKNARITVIRHMGEFSLPVLLDVISAPCALGGIVRDVDAGIVLVWGQPAPTVIA